MSNQFLTNYTEVTFLDKIKDNLRRCKSFAFSVSFIKKAGIVLLFKEIEPALFQWESMANVSAADVEKQKNSKHAYLFIRKVSDENGIVLPFIYVGKGKMTNPRKQVKFDRAKGKDVVTYLYDIVMENELPDYLQYDFGLTK